MHVYRGAVSSTDCQALAIGGATEGSEPVRVILELSRIEAPECTSPSPKNTSDEPFTMAIGTGENQEPVLERITVDGATVAFSVIEE